MPHHDDDARYDCPACEDAFPDEDTLHDHLYSVGQVY